MKKIITLISTMAFILAFAGCAMPGADGSSFSADGKTFSLSTGDNLAKSSARTGAITVLYKNINWMASPGDVNIHYNDGSGWTEVPGAVMTKHTSGYDEWLNYASITIQADSLTFCFNKNGVWDNNNGQDYRINSAGTYKIENNQIIPIEDITAADGDLYYVYNPAIYPSSTVFGFEVNIYRNGSSEVFATSQISGSSDGRHGIYARFNDLPSGVYVAKVDEVKDGYRYTSSDSFTVNQGETNFKSGSINIVKEDATEADGDLYYVYNPDIYPSSTVFGFEVKIYRNGSSEVFATSQISGSSDGRHGIYARFNDLPSGTYVAKVNEVKDGCRYTSSDSFTVEFGASYFSSGSINITKEEVNNTITVYYKNINWVASPGDINIHYNDGSGWTEVPGVVMTKHTSPYDPWLNYASFTIEADLLTFCFNKEGVWDNNNGQNYSVLSPGTYKVENGTVTAISQ